MTKESVLKRILGTWYSKSVAAAKATQAIDGEGRLEVAYRVLNATTNFKGNEGQR
jgi:hypothetical protein